eukprot:TRINITY_DN101179_c0_g1_i1.p1 TRINITY_DN101179_c0_g1~~TRINITY_DN101179_c0_g1_i1.p1  ORF type:complete len:127 (-),score=25.95 TRINITY_DN101179_c0_g1_i1:10-345(-)
MINMQSEMIELFENAALQVDQPSNWSPAKPIKPVRQPFSQKLDVSLENCPYLIDHSLLRQPKGWPTVEDMDPVIPMTMIFEVFAEIANAQSQIGRAVQQECRDRSRMPSSA